MDLMFPVEGYQSELHGVTGLPLPVIDEGPVQIALDRQAFLTAFQNTVQCGFNIFYSYGIVISGDLWNRFNIHQELEYQALIDHFCKIRKAIG